MDSDENHHLDEVTDLRSLLLPENYVYCLKSVIDDENNYRCEFVVKGVKSEDSAMVWLKEFENSSKCSWKVLRTYPSAGKYNVFRKDFRCHHNTDQRFRSEPAKRKQRHTGCPATLKLIIRRFIEFSKAKKPCLEYKDDPCVCIIEQKHNHHLNSAAALQFRRISLTTKEKLLDFFRQGYSASGALHALQTDLLLENEDNYDSVVADASNMPSLSVIQHIFDAEFFKLYGNKTGQTMHAELQQRVHAYNETSGGTAAFSVVEANIVFAVCTPIMKRIILKVPQANELVLVDAFGHMDRENHRIYFFITPCVAGGLPVGCVISDSEKEQVFKRGVELLKSCWPQEAPLVSNGPTVFMTDGDMKEQRALKTTFPDATFLLCQFHVLKAAWRWLMDSKNGIEKNQRQELYFLIKSLVEEGDEDALLFKKQTLMSNEKVVAHKKFLDYFLKLWDSRELWANCFRKGLPTRGNNTNNYVEAVFRILKDCIFERVKTCSLVQLIDFLVTRFEAYVRNRLLNFSFGRYAKRMLKKFIPSCKEALKKNVNYSGEYYVVPSEKGKTVYDVDVENCFCSCFQGCTGKLCKHLSAVILGKNLQSSLWYSDVTKSLMFELATGKQPVDEFLKPLSHNPCNASKNTTQDVGCSSVNSESQPSTSSSCYGSDKNTTIYANCQEDDVQTDVCASSEDTVVQEISNKKEHVLEELKKLYARIDAAVVDNPAVFIPAAEKMLKNAKLYASNECGLSSAMHNFAKYSGFSKLKVSKAHSGVQIPVQPTAPGRRATSSRSKRRQWGEHSSKEIKVAVKDHDYTTFGHLPQKKRKAPHNLTECVQRNVSLGHQH